MPASKETGEEETEEEAATASPVPHD